MGVTCQKKQQVRDNSSCIVIQDLYFQCSMFIDNVKLFKNKCYHILVMLPGFFSPCKTIDMCHKFFIILVSITRPNSTKIMTCSNICDYPKQIICSQILSYKTVVSSFTGRCKSTRQSPGLPWRKSFPCKGRASMHCPSLRKTNVGFHNQLFPVGKYQICPAQRAQQGELLPGTGQ